MSMSLSSSTSACSALFKLMLWSDSVCSHFLHELYHHHKGYNCSDRKGRIMLILLTWIVKIDRIVRIKRMSIDYIQNGPWRINLVSFVVMAPERKRQTLLQCVLSTAGKPLFETAQKFMFCLYKVWFLWVPSCHLGHFGLVVSSSAGAGWSWWRESSTSGPMCPCWPGRATWPCSCPVGCCSTTVLQLALNFKLRFNYLGPKRRFKWQRNQEENEMMNNCTYGKWALLPMHNGTVDWRLLVKDFSQLHPLHQITPIAPHTLFTQLRL